MKTHPVRVVVLAIADSDFIHVALTEIPFDSWSSQVDAMVPVYLLSNDVL